MEIELSERQAQTLLALAAQRLNQLGPEPASDSAEPPESDLTGEHQADDVEALRELTRQLREQLQQARQRATWAGYVADRQTPSNPPPGI